MDAAQCQQMMMSYGVATPPIDLLRPCLGVPASHGSLPATTWPSIAGIPASSVHHFAIGGSQLSFNPSTPLHVYYAYAAAAAATSLRLTLAVGNKRQFGEEAGQLQPHQHSTVATASQGSYTCKRQKTTEQQQLAAPQPPQTQCLAPPDFAQLWFVSPAAICQQQQPWAQQEQQQALQTSTAPPPIQLLSIPLSQGGGMPSVSFSSLRTPSPVQQQLRAPRLPVHLHRLLASSTVHDALTSAFSYLGFKQPSTLQLALFMMSRLDKTPKATAEVLAPEACMRYSVVVLWLAAKLQESRLGLAGASKVAVATCSSVSEVNAVELQVLKLLDWSPYRGFEDEDELLVLL